MRPEQRASETQRDSVRKELHDQVDRLVDAWPVIERQSREMGRGYPSGSEGATGDGGSLVERVALSGAFDPALASADWLAGFVEFRGHAKNLEGALRRVLPADEASVDRGRVNEVEVCAECGLPAVKVRRIDGVPYHATSCYFRVWRSRKDADVDWDPARHQSIGGAGELAG